MYHAIDRITGNPLKVHEYHLEAVTEGQDALGRVTVSVSRQDAKEGTKVRGRGTSTDVILASARAYVNALNTLDRTEKSQNSSDRVKTGSTP